MVLGRILIICSPRRPRRAPAVFLTLTLETNGHRVALDRIFDHQRCGSISTIPLHPQTLACQMCMYGLGLIHAGWIVSASGLAKMVKKYEHDDFGRCPRVLCESQSLLPVGFVDIPFQKPVKLYCGRCEDLYSPKSSHHGSINGAYFGTTFPHLLYLVYPVLLPPKTGPLADRPASPVQPPTPLPRPPGANGLLYREFGDGSSRAKAIHTCIAIGTSKEAPNCRKQTESKGVITIHILKEQNTDALGELAEDKEKRKQKKMAMMMAKFDTGAFSEKDEQLHAILGKLDTIDSAGSISQEDLTAVRRQLSEGQNMIREKVDRLQQSLEENEMITRRRDKLETRVAALETEYEELLEKMIPDEETSNVDPAESMADLENKLEAQYAAPRDAHISESVKSVNDELKRAFAVTSAGIEGGKNPAESAQDLFVELEIQLDEIKEQYNTVIRNSKAQQKKMAFLERNLQQLTLVQKQLVDQNSTLKKETGIAECKAFGAQRADTESAGAPSGRGSVVVSPKPEVLSTIASCQRASGSGSRYR
ncbi:hypothetical protein B0H13DRAFT_2477614 [Mycena leptocephala]|nr:hypothetical protein B0H13DRAFT_2477614 [Mycena leptocephala]